MKRIFISIVFTLTLNQIFACDICGCSSGNYFMGLFPQFRKHFIGTRYSFRRFKSEVAGDPTQFSKDFYQTVEIWTGFNVGRKWQLMGFVPFNINRQFTDDGIKKSQGIGDITFIANYKLMDKRTSDKHGNMISQQFWIGGGIKLPSGKFAANADDIIADANNQAGTGSIDFLLNAMYSFHINDWGFNTNMNYKINHSAGNFKFGNRFNTSAFVFYSINTSAKSTINPNVGLLYENLQGNQLNQTKILYTGGQAIFTSAGVETNFKKVSIGLNAQLPTSQHLSNGQTTAKLRGMMHVTFIF